LCSAYLPLSESILPQTCFSGSFRPMLCVTRFSSRHDLRIAVLKPAPLPHHVVSYVCFHIVDNVDPTGAHPFHSPALKSEITLGQRRPHYSFSPLGGHPTVAYHVAFLFWFIVLLPSSSLILEDQFTSTLPDRTTTSLLSALTVLVRRVSRSALPLNFLNGKVFLPEASVLLSGCDEVPPIFTALWPPPPSARLTLLLSPP